MLGYMYKESYYLSQKVRRIKFSVKMRKKMRVRMKEISASVLGVDEDSSWAVDRLPVLDKVSMPTTPTCIHGFICSFIHISAHEPVQCWELWSPARVS